MTSHPPAAWPLLFLALLLGLSTPFVPGAAGVQAQEAQAIDPLPFRDHQQEVRFQHLAGQLRCLVCQDESLLDSNADLARQMRLIVFQKMQEGLSDKQIKQYFVDRYSDYVLYRPRLRPGTWLLWFGPAAILLLGGAVVLVTVRRRHRMAAENLQVAAIDPDDPDDW